MKNPKIIGVVALLIIILGGAGYFVYAKNKIQEKPLAQNTVSNLEEPKVKEVKPEEIGLSLSARSDGKAVNMTINNVSGISSIDYELNYNAEGNIPRGVIGSIEIKPSDSVIKRELLLGTCSRNVCKYDAGVTEVNLVLKLTYSNGEFGSVEQKLSL